MAVDREPVMMITFRNEGVTPRYGRHAGAIECLGYGIMGGHG